MKAYYSDESVTMFNASCLDALPCLASDSVDSIVTDPPYELGFMGKSWDRSGIAYNVEVWRECLRVLKPGGHLLAFGGSRTYHRLACAIEDAGFEIRDQIQWIYGSGFPKSLDVSKAIDQQERGAMVREKLLHFSSVRGVDGKWLEAKGVASAASFLDWTTGGHVPSDRNWQIVKGALEVTPEEEAAFERERVASGSAGLGKNRPAFEGGYKATYDVTLPATETATQWNGWGTALKPAHEPIVLARKPLVGTVAENVLRHGTGGLNVDACRIEGAKPDTTRGAGGLNGRYGPLNAQGRILDDGLGRWPANVIHDGSREVLAAFPDAPGQLRYVGPEHGERPSRGIYGDFGARPENEPRGDSGSAARFFYCAKASKEDREEGLEDLPLRSAGDVTDRKDGSDGLNSPRAGAGRTNGSRNHHPTVKPTDLMRYLVRLVTPYGGTVLDPFAGSGSTGKACVREGMKAILIEKETEYCEIAKRRARLAQGRLCFEVAV